MDEMIFNNLLIDTDDNITLIPYWDEYDNNQRNRIISKIIKFNYIGDAHSCFYSSYVELTDEQRELLEPLALIQEMINKERRARRFN